MVHSCCCMLFSCILWFEITSQNDLNLHSKIRVEIRKRKRKGFFLPSLYSAYWPIASQSSHVALFPRAGPSSSARFQRRPPHSLPRSVCTAQQRWPNSPKAQPRRSPLFPPR